MAKVGKALCLGETGGPESICDKEANRSQENRNSHKEEFSVKPQSFKTLIGKGHPEFSSSRQQVIINKWLID